MNTKLLNKSCPTCKSNISLAFFRNREEIFQCNNCKSLLIENPKRKLTSGIVFFTGLIVASGSAAMRVPVYVALLIFLISFFVALKITNLVIIKKNLIIRNKLTNQISYVNNSDWEEIVKNSVDNEIQFEIVENLE